MEVADTTNASLSKKPVRSYAEAVYSASSHTASPAKKFAGRGLTVDVAPAAPPV
jgi:hypothetical protein